jgi:homoserine acetyltransferase
MVESGYRLITEGLNVAHLRLIIGSSMGGMHAWVGTEMYPNLMDGVVPISCQPVEISGRNGIDAASRFGHAAPRSTDGRHRCKYWPFGWRTSSECATALPDLTGKA